MRGSPDPPPPSTDRPAARSVFDAGPRTRARWLPSITDRTRSCAFSSISKARDEADQQTQAAGELTRKQSDTATACIRGFGRIGTARQIPTPSIQPQTTAARSRRKPSGRQTGRAAGRSDRAGRGSCRPAGCETRSLRLDQATARAFSARRRRAARSILLVEASGSASTNQTRRGCW